MKNRTESLTVLEMLKTDNIRKQKRGLHFILASVVIWAAVTAVYASALPISTKNLLTFCCSAPLVPLAFALSKMLHIDFQNKENPMSLLGLVFTMNQLLYILIAMWIFAAVPEKMLMVYAMIFGAHLLPYGWLYRSKSYYVLSVLIPPVVLAIGLLFPPVVVSVFMTVTEIIFSVCLVIENHRNPVPEEAI